MRRTLSILIPVLLLILSAAWAPDLAAQQKGFAVQGTVTDSEGETLVGVFISVKGTKTGTTTDLDGRYNLSLSGPATLVFQYMGMADMEVPVDKARTLDIVSRKPGRLVDEYRAVNFGQHGYGGEICHKVKRLKS